MDSVSKLTTGFKIFRDGGFQENRATYEALVDHGQSPKVALIACSDSRVDPATVLQADPGDLFVIRNVANLVPPNERDGQFHGTSAALEYAVEHLEVGHLIVFGHAHCGGIRSMFANPDEGSEANQFVLTWMSLVRSAYLRVQGTMPNASEDEKVMLPVSIHEQANFAAQHEEHFFHIDVDMRRSFASRRQDHGRKRKMFGRHRIVVAVDSGPAGPHIAHLSAPIFGIEIRLELQGVPIQRAGLIAGDAAFNPLAHGDPVGLFIGGNVFSLKFGNIRHFSLLHSQSVHHKAAIDRQALTGDKIGGVGQQKHRCPGYIFGQLLALNRPPFEIKLLAV